MPDQALEKIQLILENVCDPEIPVLTIRDLGILRDVRWAAPGVPEVVITPTYSGCPAMSMIEVNIRAALQEEGIDNVTITTVLQPAWTTDWISAEGREKLRAFGIAPPVSASLDKKALQGGRHAIQCPICGSDNTEMISQFGSTSCKSLFRCLDCLEAFDYFKCH
ncbi:MAG: phenylacetate-CoA oxygenase subunit PaaJ [Lewinellaceae bacterium]|nr:phenylacetate-CoA oxygenase subunit PaaJ [Lewinellaceae bacterium]